MTPTAFLDHLVIAADTLDQGAAYVQARLGVAPAGGGKHTFMGTHNRVLKLGEDRYLEVIAIDPDGSPPDFPRWFNLDDPKLNARLKLRPRLITWVVRTDDLDAHAEAVYGQRVWVRPMQRDALRWHFAFTADGSLPGKGLIPHMIQWQTISHPAESMVDTGCMLVSLEGFHTDPASIKRVMACMGLDESITIHSVSKQRPPGLLARINSPNGVVVLD